MTPWFSTHRRSVLFLVAVAAIAGAVAAWQLPVSLFPRIDFPRIVLSVPYTVADSQYDCFRNPKSP